MKKIIKVLGLIFLTVLILTGCSIKQSVPGNQKLTIANNNFSGSFIPDNGNKRQKISIHFTNDLRAVVTMIGISSDDGRWTKQIFIGSYRITKEKVMGITYDKGVAEGYNSKQDLIDNTIPTKIVDLPAKGQTLELKVKKDYLVLAKNKLHETDNAEVANYDSYVRENQKRFDKKYAKLSNRSFMSPATDLLENGIAFKGDKFIWKYGGESDYSNGLDMGGSLAIFVGTYKLVGKKLTLFVSDNTPLYMGTISELGKNKYQDQTAAVSLPKELTFTFSKNNRLHMETISYHLGVTDMLDYGRVEGTPNYDQWQKKYNVEKINAKMQQVTASDSKDTDEDDSVPSLDAIPVEDSKSVTEAFPTKEDFEDWVENYYQDNIDEDFSSQGVYEPDTESLRESADDSPSDTPVVYSVDYSLDDDSDSDQVISITDDGRIYSGDPETYDDDLTHAFRDYAKN